GYGLITRPTCSSHIAASKVRLARKKSENFILQEDITQPENDHIDPGPVWRRAISGLNLDDLLYQDHNSSVVCRACSKMSCPGSTPRAVVRRRSEICHRRFN